MRTSTTLGSRWAIVAMLAALALTAALVPAATAQTGLQFNGTNQYVTFGRADSLGVKQFTVETWFKRLGAGATTSTGTGGVTAVPLVSKGRGEGDGSTLDMNYFLGIRGSDGVLCADYEEGTGQTSPGLNHPITGATRVSLNTWHHAAVTFDGTTLRLYLNGDLESTVSVGAGRLPQWLSLQHAGLATAMTSTGVAAGYLNGVLDEPRVWNYARSQSEIQTGMAIEITSATGLRGRWGLNEGSGTTAANSVATGPNGTLTNTPTWVTGTTFTPPAALAFAGANDYVTFGNATGLGLGQFTLECWFRRDGTGVTASTGTGGITAIPLVTKGVGEQDASNVDMNYFLGIRASDNVLAADFEEGASGASPGLNHPIAGVTPIVTGTWYHAAATYDGTTWRLYLNGALESELAVGQPPQASSIQHAGLGTALNSTGTAAGFLYGVLDEVRVWDHARSGAEITATVNSQITSPQTGLVACWALDEASANSVTGSAGTAISGTVTGTGWGWVAGAPFNAVPPAPPAAPTALAATPVSHAQMQLSWTDNANNETTFQIDRSTTGSGGAFTLLATVGSNITTYYDSNLQPYAEYCYRVRAVNSSGASDYTDVACATTPAEGASALDFAGTNGYVTFGAAPALGLAQFTLECWFRRDGAGTTTTTGTYGIEDAIPLVTKGRGEAEAGTVDTNYFFGLDQSDSVIVADFEEGSGGVSPGRNHPVSGITKIQTGQWYHAAATYDGSTWRLYLNGQLETELSVGQPVQSQSVQHAAIASALTTTGVPEGFFDGVVDEVRIWSRALTLSELRLNINAEIASAQTNLVARWGLNEGTATSVNNSVATTVLGTITGTGWVWVTPGAPFDLVINDPPNPPTLAGPTDGAVGVPVPATLEVAVTDPEGDSLTVEFWGRPVPAQQADDFTILMVPDTQYYAAELNGATAAMYAQQTQWAVTNRALENVVYIAQVGDCVESGDNSGNPVQWDNAWAAWQLVENPVTTGLPDGIPYGIAVGNHDQSPNGDPTGTTTFYNQYFGESHFTGRTYYGGHYGANNDNHVDLFSASGMDFIAIYMEYDQTPDAPVLAWAESLLVANPTRRGIVVSHYLMNTGTQGSFGTQGQLTYDALKDQPNLFLMLCGHNPGEGRRTDVFAGNTVHTVLADFQSRTNGGNGWMRILRFSPSTDEIQVRTYSPVLGQWELDGDSDFVLPYTMLSGEGFALLGTVAGVASGGTASIAWPGLAPGTQYEWYAVVSDSEGSRTGTTWRFTTASDYTIVASAGPGGSIAPSGTVHVPAGHDTTFTIAPDAGYLIADVLVDGFSVGAVASHTFYAVDANHTIAASFTANTYALTVNVTGSGAVTRNPDAATYTHGTRVELTAVPGAGFAFTGWAGDLTGTANPDTVLMDAAKTVTASFVDVAGPVVQVTSPNGTEIVSHYAPATITWEASDNVGVTSVDIELSRSGPAGPWETLATGEANDGSFEWTVTGPPATDAYVRVVAHDGAGNPGSDTSDAAFEISDVLSATEEGPVTEYALGTMAPNPLVGTGRIRYAVPQTGRVTIQVVDVRGRIVASLLDAVRAPGRYVVRWDGSTPGGHAATGVYFMQMQAGGKRITQRVMVVR